MPDGVFDLSPHGADVLVGRGPRYPWGGLYGGHIVAQALRAAAESVEPDFTAHSIRAYFIRRGDDAEPVRYEVDRIRNGRSFVTRRVVARQAVGAILNAESSFQRAEQSADEQMLTMPDVPDPTSLPEDSWSSFFERAQVPAEQVGGPVRDGSGRVVVWARVTDDVGDPDDPHAQLLHRCWMAYVSDDFPTDSAIRAHPDGQALFGGDHDHLYAASLDHTIWFHRPLRADDWHLYDFTCHAFVGGRGLSLGHVFAPDGTHVATVAQEVLVRDTRQR